MEKIPYATLPSFTVYSKAFYKAADFPQGLYTVITSESDREMVSRCGLPTTVRRFGCQSLYTFLHRLIDAMGPNYDADINDWAGEFACHILNNLGFDWK